MQCSAHERITRRLDSPPTRLSQRVRCLTTCKKAYNVGQQSSRFICLTIWTHDDASPANCKTFWELFFQYLATLTKMYLRCTLFHQIPAGIPARRHVHISLVWLTFKSLRLLHIASVSAWSRAFSPCSLFLRADFHSTLALALRRLYTLALLQVHRFVEEFCNTLYAIRVLQVSIHMLSQMLSQARYAVPCVKVFGCEWLRCCQCSSPSCCL